MSKRIMLWAAVTSALFLGGSQQGVAQDPTRYYLPVITAVSERTDLPNGLQTYVLWNGVAELYNPLDRPADYRNLHYFGSNRQPAGTVPSDQGVVGPGTGAYHRPGLDLRSPGVGFTLIEVPQGVVVRSYVQRKRVVQQRGSENREELILGQAALPVYGSLFPAGSVALAGGVELGNLWLAKTSHDYFAANQVYRRRVNVTLMNGGDEPATFTVTSEPYQVLVTPPAPQPLESRTVVVPARDVYQINGFPVPVERLDLPNVATSFDKIWFRITADQPFLAYVSTVFGDPQPDGQPFEVYQAYRIE